MRVRIPQIISVSDALKLYYTKRELRNADIKLLFGEGIGSARVAKLKEIARDVMRNKSVPTLDDLAVNTDCAYEAWGINIEELEKNYGRMKRLGLLEE